MIDRDTIIRMAREAGFSERHGIVRTMHSSGAWVGINEELERFAALVAEHERKACAQVCDNIDTEYEGEDVLATWCSAAIRARGQA